MTGKEWVLYIITILLFSLVMIFLIGATYFSISFGLSQLLGVILISIFSLIGGFVLSLIFNKILSSFKLYFVGFGICSLVLVGMYSYFYLVYQTTLEMELSGSPSSILGLVPNPIFVGLLSLALFNGVSVYLYYKSVKTE